jgi:hypothetical protein
VSSCSYSSFGVRVPSLVTFYAFPVSWREAGEGSKFSWHFTNLTVQEYTGKLALRIVDRVLPYLSNEHRLPTLLVVMSDVGSPVAPYHFAFFEGFSTPVTKRLFNRIGEPVSSWDSPSKICASHR